MKEIKGIIVKRIYGATHKLVGIDKKYFYFIKEDGTEFKQEINENTIIEVVSSCNYEDNNMDETSYITRYMYYNRKRECREYIRECIEELKK